MSNLVHRDSLAEIVNKRRDYLVTKGMSGSESMLNKDLKHRKSYERPLVYR